MVKDGVFNKCHRYTQRKKTPSVSSKTRTFDLPMSISDALSLLLISFVAVDNFLKLISSLDISQEKRIIDYRFCARN